MRLDEKIISPATTVQFLKSVLDIMTPYRPMWGSHLIHVGALRSGNDWNVMFLGIGSYTDSSVRPERTISIERPDFLLKTLFVSDAELEHAISECLGNGHLDLFGVELTLPASAAAHVLYSFLEPTAHYHGCFSRSGALNGPPSLLLQMSMESPAEALAVNWQAIQSQCEGVESRQSYDGLLEQVLGRRINRNNVYLEWAAQVDFHVQVDSNKGELTLQMPLGWSEPTVRWAPDSLWSDDNADLALQSSKGSLAGALPKAWMKLWIHHDMLPRPVIFERKNQPLPEQTKPFIGLLYSMTDEEPTIGIERWQAELLSKDDDQQFELAVADLFGHFGFIVLFGGLLRKTPCVDFIVVDQSQRRACLVDVTLESTGPKVRTKANALSERADALSTWQSLAGWRVRGAVVSRYRDALTATVQVPDNISHIGVDGLRDLLDRDDTYTLSSILWPPTYSNTPYGPPF